MPVSTSLRTRSGCLTTSAWAIMPPSEKEKMSIVSNTERRDEGGGVVGGMASMLSGTEPVEAPTPRWSNVMTWRFARWDR